MPLVPLCIEAVDSLSPLSSRVEINSSIRQMVSFFFILRSSGSSTNSILFSLSVISAVDAVVDDFVVDSLIKSFSDIFDEVVDLLDNKDFDLAR